MLLLPFELYYHISQYMDMKGLIRIHQSIDGFDINKITQLNTIIVINADDLDELPHNVHFKHLIFKNVLTDVDGDKLIRKNGISGDNITFTFKTRKNLINMAVFTKFFKKSFIQINCSRKTIIYNVICNLFSYDGNYYEIQINNAKIKCLDYNYPVGKIDHFIFNKCFPLTDNDKNHISSSCDKLTIIS